MECTTCQELVSASLDGEAGAAQLAPEPLAAAARHLERCEGCRSFAREARLLQQRLRAAPAPLVPDLTTAVLRATEAAPHTDRRLRMLRLVLVAAAIAQVVLAAPALILGDDDSMPIHAAHHLGAFELALAVGFVVVALRPRAALPGFLPVATVVVLAGLVESVADTLGGHTTLVHESTHLAGIAGLTAAWLLGSHRRPVRRPAHRLRLAA